MSSSKTSCSGGSGGGGAGGSAEEKHEIVISSQEQNQSVPLEKEVESGRVSKPSFAHCKAPEGRRCEEGKEDMEYGDSDERMRLEVSVLEVGEGKV